MLVGTFASIAESTKLLANTQLLANTRLQVHPRLVQETIQSRLISTGMNPFLERAVSNNFILFITKKNRKGDNAADGASRAEVVSESAQLRPLFKGSAF